MGVRIFEYTIEIDGQEVPLPTQDPNNVTIVNARVYVDGQEWKDGEWKTTIRSLWHQLF